MRFKESEIAVFSMAHLLNKSCMEVFLVKTSRLPFKFPAFLHKVWKQADNAEKILQTSKDPFAILYGKEG